MSVVIIIPARYASTRYRGKPLVPLVGATGQAKPLIQRAWEAAKSVAGNPQIVIATDDTRIKDVAEGFGAQVVMTSVNAQNGTERVSEAFEILNTDADIIVNLQGDAPLTPAWFVEELITSLRENTQCDMATPVLRADGATLNALLADRRAGRVGGTTAVFDAHNRALYFSKEVIPYTPKQYDDSAQTPVWHHVGCYAYRPSALQFYKKHPVSALENLEGLEQLRFLEHGARVLCVRVDGKGRKFWELNNREDKPLIEKILQDQEIP